MAASGWPLREPTCATELRLNGGRGTSRRTPLMSMAALPPEQRRMSAVTTWPKPWHSTSTGCFDRVFRFRSRSLRPMRLVIRSRSQCTRSRCLSRRKEIGSGWAAWATWLNGRRFGVHCEFLLRPGGAAERGCAADPRLRAAWATCGVALNPPRRQSAPAAGGGQRLRHHCFRVGSPLTAPTLF